MNIHTPIHILESLAYHLLHKFGLLPGSISERYTTRKVICGTCPLYSKGFCSRKKALRLSPGDRLPKHLDKIPKWIKTKADSEFIYENAVWKTGCGCFLKLKQMSNSHCGLYKW